jgi:uncharacterized Zn-finger protein
MGMYDVVMIPCPYCEKYTAKQSKGGGCTLSEYIYPDVPGDVLSYLSEEETVCKYCGGVFFVKAEFYIAKRL